MVTRDKFDLLTVEQIKREIEERVQLIDQMVGWLYPSILRDEITVLADRQFELLNAERSRLMSKGL